ALLVLQSLNQAFDVATARYAALRTHVPGAIFILLPVLALACAFFAGIGMARRRGPPSILHMIMFAGVIAVTAYVILNLEFAGAFYAHDSDRGMTLAITSALAVGAGVGSAFWLIHLSHQQESGFDRTVQDFEQGTAISLLVTAGIVYVVARVSGLVLAPEAIE